ncbi:ORF122 [Ranid herpesvirus 1]|uniref:ORF122 n=1 Tax=Ranid herpesvirus 1 TaxID=85655 RepID=Q14VK8_9VIRU|nr:ORF122 [Ranid herpesvirus 1]ABG25736.1 ORF122 [Ranid herpesvirus 1]
MELLNRFHTPVLSERDWTVLRGYVDHTAPDATPLFAQSPAVSFAEVAVALHILAAHLTRMGCGGRKLFAPEELCEILRPVTRRALESAYGGVHPGEGDPQYDGAIPFLAMSLEEIEESYAPPQSQRDPEYLMEAARCIYAMRLAVRVHNARYGNVLNHGRGEALLYHVHGSLNASTNSSVVRGERTTSYALPVHTLPLPDLYGGGVEVELRGAVRTMELLLLAEKGGVWPCLCVSSWLRWALLDFNMSTQLEAGPARRARETTAAYEAARLNTFLSRSEPFEGIGSMQKWQVKAMHNEDVFRGRRGGLVVEAPDSTGRDRGPHKPVVVTRESEVAQHQALERVNRDAWRDRRMPTMRSHAWRTAHEQRVASEDVLVPGPGAAPKLGWAPLEQAKPEESPPHPEQDAEGWQRQYERLAVSVPVPKPHVRFRAPHLPERQ